MFFHVFSFGSRERKVSGKRALILLTWFCYALIKRRRVKHAYEMVGAADPESRKKGPGAAGILKVAS
jgi:hypothetical protein